MLRGQLQFLAPKRLRGCNDVVKQLALPRDSPVSGCFSSCGALPSFRTCAAFPTLLRANCVRTFANYGVALYRPIKKLKFKWPRRPAPFRPSDVEAEVDVMLEGTPKAIKGRRLDDLAAQLELESKEAVTLALMRRAEVQPGYKVPGTANLSLVLCDDAHIQALNLQHR